MKIGFQNCLNVASKCMKGLGIENKTRKEFLLHKNKLRRTHYSINMLLISDKTFMRSQSGAKSRIIMITNYNLILYL